ncbi:hypothetical protein [Fibrobacter sp. UWH4]|uniref:hypothetical protein n=1 Tax=Fibrobacter sp. UWH4 TaxID=1896210 RepID=UPI00091D9CCE|nr:hypothetical protein [Fibrobacter sp. UWH4]SHK27879.1 hypothetical protein SAMN05720762_101253 [Fibrobacter sp. UWH4]
MKMINLSKPLALVAFIAVCFCAGCSDSHELTGTAEETNEFAFAVSSSSEEESSSSGMLPYSSSEKFSPESSSGKGDAVSSSSRHDNSGVGSSAVESSSSVEPEVSSSSQEQESSSSEDGSSSSVAAPQGGTQSSSSHENPNSLEHYVEELGLNVNQLYENVLAAGLTEEKDSDTAPGQAMATEFDGPWPHQFVKENIGALPYFFPEAADEYAGLVDSIESGLADGGCGLYMMNVYGNEKAIAYVVADITADKIVVMDVAAGSCPNSAVNKIFHFLFRYCGEIESRPEIEHVEVNLNVSEGSCPDFDMDSEWVK